MNKNDHTILMIPARYGSTRFPGKPLVLLDGKPMIRRVFDTCVNTGIDTVVLTDDSRVADIIPVENVYYDTTDYENGTERCAGAILSDRFSNYRKIINVQGDMPDVSIDMIHQVNHILGIHGLATVFTELDDAGKNNPNTVKMIHSVEKNKNIYKALWFGRGFTGYGNHHLGIYGYHRYILEKYTKMPITHEEKTEKLEQLRWLKYGLDIYASNVRFDGMEINTPEDAVEWNKKNSH